MPASNWPQWIDGNDRYQRAAIELVNNYRMAFLNKSASGRSMYFYRPGVPMKIRVSDHPTNDPNQFTMLLPERLHRHEMRELVRRTVEEWEAECFRRGYHPKRRRRRRVDERV